MLGKLLVYAEEKAAKTSWAYQTIIDHLRNLKELEMVHPDIR